MASAAVQIIRNALLPGYSLQRAHGEGWGVVDSSENPVRNADTGQPIRFHSGISHAHAIDVVKALADAGAAVRPDPPRRSPRPRETPRHVTEIVPVEMAQEVMRDPKSTGRERTLAKEVIRLTEEHGKVVGYLRAALVKLREMGYE